MPFDGHIIGDFDDHDALRRGYESNVCVGENLQQGASVAEGAINHRSTRAVPSSPNERRTGAIPQWMATVRYPENLH